MVASYVAVGVGSASNLSRPVISDFAECFGPLEIAENEERCVFWRRRQALLATVLRRAVERGEIPSDLPIQLAIGMVVGPLWFRLFVTDQPVGAREIRVLADLMTAALTKKTPRARSSR
jgi:hypothetical protein